ncbi:MAG: PD40 domain-containing protein [Chloroflexi bacterium]|nr:PD40 domain-containing protein [Chloroflexota bacterium]
MFRVLVLLGGSALLAALACQSAAPDLPPPATLAPASIPKAPPDLRVPGSFVYAQDGNLWSLTHRSRPRRLTSLPSGSFPAAPVASPDGRQVALSLFLPSQSANDPGGSDLYLLNREGGNLQPLLPHDLPGSALEPSDWSPDGRTLLFTYRAQVYRDNRFVEEILRVERTATDQGSREHLLPNAAHASYFPDGKRLVYTITNPSTYRQSLWVANSDGTEPRQIVDAERFTALFAPRPSPDGRFIVFAAPSDGQTAAPGGRGAPALTSWLTSWLLPRAAQAHGIPWELWLVQSNGEGLQRLTPPIEGTPYPVWLPGGETIAFLGELGLYLVDRSGQQVVWLEELTGGIGLTWLPEQPGP